MNRRRIEDCFRQSDALLMEGALGQRLKTEYGLKPAPMVDLAGVIDTEKGRQALTELWEQYIGIAVRYGLPLLAQTTTRRANAEKVRMAGRDKTLLEENLKLLRQVMQRYDGELYAGGMLGCKGDAYTGAGALSREKAHRFHSWAAEAFAGAGADYLFAGIMPTLPEAMGMAEAMSDTGIPYIISFTILRDGGLIDGTPIHDAIAAIDEVTVRPPLCYMANCVHPTIAYEALSQKCNQTPEVRGRFLGLQANTSPLSYAELEHAMDYKNSSPEGLAREMLRLKTDMGLKLLGGCCGTTDRYIEEIAKIAVQDGMKVLPE